MKRSSNRHRPLATRVRRASIRDRVPEPQYDSNMKAKRVYPDGTFFWKGTQVFITKTLAGQSIGLEPLDDRYWKVHFATFPLARFDSHKLILQPMPAGGG
jgi:hypothetical protein